MSARPSGEYYCGPKAEEGGAYDEAGDMYFWVSGVFEKALYLGVPGSILPGLDFE